MSENCNCGCGEHHHHHAEEESKYDYVLKEYAAPMSDAEVAAKVKERIDKHQKEYVLRSKEIPL